MLLITQLNNLLAPQVPPPTPSTGGAQTRGRKFEPIRPLGNWPEGIRQREAFDMVLLTDLRGEGVLTDEELAVLAALK